MGGQQAASGAGRGVGFQGWGGWMEQTAPANMAPVGGIHPNAGHSLQRYCYLLAVYWSPLTIASSGCTLNVDPASTDRLLSMHESRKLFEFQRTRTPTRDATRVRTST